jgi:hypothetical protein
MYKMEITNEQIFNCVKYTKERKFILDMLKKDMTDHIATNFKNSSVISWMITELYGGNHEENKRIAQKNSYATSLYDCVIDNNDNTIKKFIHDMEVGGIKIEVTKNDMNEVSMSLTIS